MRMMVSTVDVKLEIPPKMRGIFPNEEPLTFDLKAGEPQEVPDYVLKYYTKNRPHVFSEAVSSKPQQTKPEPEPEPEPEEKKEFDPVEFLQYNYENIEEAVEELKYKELQKVAKQLNLNVHKQTKERIKERIVHDVNVKNKKTDEISEHKDASQQ